jgi:hypothetical protein
MRYLLLCFAMVVAGLSSAANASITFTLTQVGGSSPIVLGSSANFEIYISSPVFIGDSGSNFPGPGGGPFSGYTVNLGTFTQDGTRALGTAGNFSSGTFSYDIRPRPAFPEYNILPDAPQTWDVTTTRGVAFSTAVGAGAILHANTPTLFGTLVLNTTGAQEGLYRMQFTELSVLGFSNFSLGTVNGGPINFEITAVPEPTSIATSLGLALAFGIYWRRRLSRPSSSI